MKFSAPILAAAVAAMYTAPTVEGYSLFGPSFFEPSLTFSPMMRRQRALANANRANLNSFFDDSAITRANRYFDDTFKQSSPRYEIVNGNDQLQIAMDVPGVKMEDVDVSLEEGGKILTIRGHRRARTDESSFTSKFSQSFSLDPVIDVDNITAHLVDGVLTVSAPKDMKRLEENIKSIPILESAPPAVETPKLAAEEPAAAAAEEETVAVEEKEEEEAAAEEKDEEVVDLDEEVTKEATQEEKKEEL